MVLQNKTANKGRAANVRAATDPSLNPRVAREPRICLLTAPNSSCSADRTVNYERLQIWPVAAIERITDAAHCDVERAPHATKAFDTNKRQRNC